jgi:hypothetical protein
VFLRELFNSKINIMRKRIFLNCLIAASFVIGLAFMSGCEGPTGPAGPAGRDGVDGADGTDGTDGVDGNVTCLQCHSAETPQIILEQFNQSVHVAGEIAVDYAGGRDRCAACHSSEGFIEFARTGAVAENISQPTPFVCKTCHSIHETFEQTDYALRLADPINFIFDTTATTYDMGNSNLCANCHQSRRAGPYDMGGDTVEIEDVEVVVPDGYFFISSTHYGPHHGAQSNVMAGVGFSEIEGSFGYPAPESASHYDLDYGMCTGCHMATYGNGAGGHTWNPALDGCNVAECHDGAITSVDENNLQVEIEGLLDELRDLLVAEGVVEFVEEEHYELNPETGQIELVVTPEGYEPIVGLHPVELAQAFFNWIGLEEDRSHGVHNPAYTKALLENSIEAVEGFAAL